MQDIFQYHLTDLSSSLIEEDVILRAHPHGSADDVYVSSNVSSIDVRCARCRRIETRQDGPKKHKPDSASVTRSQRFLPHHSV